MAITAYSKATKLEISGSEYVLTVGFNALIWVSKVIQDCFGFASIRLVIAHENARLYFQPIRFKSYTNYDLVIHIFPRLKQFACFLLLTPYDNFFCSVLCCDNFGFDIKTINRNVFL